MTDKVHLKPSRKDLLVFNPETGKPLPQDGASVTMDRYWSRRIKEGDALKASPAFSKSTKETKDKPSGK